MKLRLACLLVASITLVNIGCSGSPKAEPNSGARVITTETKLDVWDEIEFRETGELTPESHVSLDKLITLLAGNPQIELLGIEVTTETLDLATLRAQTIVDYCVAHGSEASRFTLMPSASPADGVEFVIVRLRDDE